MGDNKTIIQCADLPCIYCMTTVTFFAYCRLPRFRKKQQVVCSDCHRNKREKQSSTATEDDGA